MAERARQILDMNAFDPKAGGASANPLLDRRLANYGAASVLFYREPIEMVSARGAWLTAADGTRYLDFYNNVPSVGHCHPAVVEAVAGQMARLNVHTRYLNAVVDDYLERLKATFPATLSNVVLTCSGSEANDLAIRIAASATGATGIVVTETAYHGNTATTTDISPSAFKRGAPPDHVVAIPAPATAAYGSDIAAGFADSLSQAISELERRGHRLAAFICDTIFSSDGVFAEPAGFLAKAVDRARAAGGLFIADEVQPGFARTGEAFWGFGRHGVEPDLVTMGKPMGNGFPMAGVAVRPDLLQAFIGAFGYFNTFGGNPVAAAAGAAVLTAIAEDGLQGNALRVGRHLKQRLAEVSSRRPEIAAVRGAGLFLGIDLCRDGDPARPDPDLATTVINGLKQRRVLIGAAGRYGHTLKVRPPLCLTVDEADIFVDALDAVLGA